jgi:calcineurin-like phosphoesterase family protein
MKIWVIADTHFGHPAIIEYCQRPANFEVLVLENWAVLVKPEDLVIHLGDLCFHHTIENNARITAMPGRKVLIRGNHDLSRPESWYMERGWDFCCDGLLLEKFGKRIWFSHEPAEPSEAWDLNIHGHLHNTAHHGEQRSEKHILVSLEYCDYKPVLLRTLIGT